MCSSYTELEDLTGQNSSHSLLKCGDGEHGDGHGRGSELLRVTVRVYLPHGEASWSHLELCDAVVRSPCCSPALDAFMNLWSLSCSTVKELC